MDMKYELTCFIFLTWMSLIGQQKEVYELETKRELAVYSISAGVLGVSYLLDQGSPNLNLNDISTLSSDDIWTLDRSAVNFTSDVADLGSDITLLATSFAPLTLLFSHEIRHSKKEIITLYGETIAVNGALTFLIKNTTNRKRPFVYNNNIPLEEKIKSRATQSFISGHTSQSAALAFFTAKVFTDYYPESKYKFLIWSAAISLPALTAYLRYRSGNHFPTDVIAGYIIGGTIGYLVPQLHKKMKDKHVFLNGGSSGISLQIRW